MSQDFMDAELFADFIVEAKEHLETIEPNLLGLEKSPDSLGLLNEIFRPMHSLKGASGFLGLNRINLLAHKSENILDELRKGTFLVTPEIMDIILSSTDALRQMLESLETTNTEGNVETEHIIEKIDAVLAGEPLPQTAVPEQKVLTQTPVIDEQATQTEHSATHTQHPASTPLAPAVAHMPVHIQGQAQQNSAIMNPKEWIATRPLKDEYALTAFGEGHLKDFIDESNEIVENLNTGLLRLEEQPVGQDDLVNDLFRYFHNLKGNSGIIAYHDLNQLTHEAETLLNNVRRGEVVPTHELIDLLLFVVDVMESLVHGIEPGTGVVHPPDTSEVVAQLQQVLAGGAIALPQSMYQTVLEECLPEHTPDATPTQESPSGNAVETETIIAEETAPDMPAVAVPATEVVHPEIIPCGTEGEDDDIFRITVRQQVAIIHAAMDTLQKDSGHKDSIDAMFRCLQAIKNACNFVGFEEGKVYAERTANIVDAARKTDMDFGMMLDILSQEVAIIQEIIDKYLATPHGDTPATQDAAITPSVPVPVLDAQQDEASVPLIETPVAPALQEVPDAQPEPVTQAVTPQAEPPVQQAPAPVRPAPAPAPLRPPPAASVSPTAAPAAPAAQEAPKGSSTIRVDHEKLDHLMNLIGELIINRNRYTLIARHLEEGGTEVDVAQVAQSLSETTYAMARISDDLQDTIMKVRMVPVASVFSRFPRLVRDLSRKSGKEVDLILEGEETELDKSVVEVIGDPLVHLIRNAVDHGVEAEADRIACGKDPKGRVVLRAYHKGNSVAIEIEDDGKGIDPEKMREVAVRKGILTQEDARQLDDREAMELIFAPGFSSAEKITDISGRGVGMDVVRTNIKNLKGSVNITSEIGKGTRFTLLLPLTLAIIDALMVNVSGEMYAIPLDAVSETTKIEAHRLTDVKGRKVVTLRGEVLGIVELAEFLNLPRPDVLPDVISIVVIHDNDRRLGLVVDRLLERQEIVIKPLGAYLGDLQGISGATIMGDGSVILILDPHELYLMATSRVA